MKKLLIIFSLLYCGTLANAQITYEHSYIPPDPLGDFVRIVHFSSHGYKYVNMNQNTSGGYINLYNLNHSLYKTINIPSLPAGQMQVYYISDSLFNTNGSNIEYLVSDIDNGQIGHVMIFDDLGNTLFSKDSVCMGGLSPWWPYTEPIFYTPNGFKMILISYVVSTENDSELVYNLPGALPCEECVNGNTKAYGNYSGYGQLNNSGFLLNAYPNPAKNSVTIKYELPAGINKGDLVFYDLHGREVKTFTVDRTFNSLLVSTADLAAGTYFYVLRAGNNYVGSKKMVIIK